MHLSAENKAKFIQQFTDPNLSIKDLERIWGKASGTLYRWGFELGIHRPKRKGELQLALGQVRDYCMEVSRELPPALFVPPKVAHVGTGRWMELVLELSDLHFGRLTSSFDAEVAGERMALLVEQIAEIVAWLRLKYTVKRLHIFGLGDIVVGESIGRNITLEELEHNVLLQVYNIAVPQLVLFTGRLAGMFEQVLISTVRGNHGSMGKFAPSKTANWDTVAYLAWEAKGMAWRNVQFNIATASWYNYARVGKTNWLLIHGDQFSIGGGKPYNGIKTKIDLWHNSMPHPFDYVAGGHFHHFFNVGEAWFNGTLLTDDDWSREVLGRVGDCGQLMLGITDRGIAQVFPIRLGGGK